MSLLDPSITFPSLADSIGLDFRLKKAIARLGHIRPTLVQSKCIPLAISHGRDLLVRARTGSGKTLAYCLPLLHKLLVTEEQQQQQQQQGLQQGHNSNTSSSIRAIVLVPTRELCIQIYDVLQSLIYYCDEIVSVVPLTGRGGHGGGGNSSNKNKKVRDELARQEAMLRDRPNVIVATPGGLLTHIQSGAVNLKSSVETLVVDEADLVLSFGYSKDVSEIMNSLPRIYQGFLMSATLSPEVDSLKKIVLHSPVTLKLEQDDSTNERDGSRSDLLKQFYLRVPKKDKNLVVYVFLKLGLLKGKGLFFVSSTNGAYGLKLFLEQFHIRSVVLNSELPFRSRLNIIEQFNVGNFDYLIATDESKEGEKEEEKEEEEEDDDDADDDNDSKKKHKKQQHHHQKNKNKNKDTDFGVSRGMDFRNVSFVVNFDFPLSPESYAHRVGRTARGGRKGVALSLVELESKEQNEMLSDVQDEQPTIPLEQAADGSGSSAGGRTLSVAATAAEGDDHGGGGGDGAAAVSSGAVSQDQAQPIPLDFNLQEIEGFRYRVEDVSGAVTRTAIRETRAAELRAEILNSERLQSHFEEHPADLQLLRHDRVATHISKVQDHLKDVPKYLLPRGMQVANLNRKRKRRRVRRGTGGPRREDNDPLRSYDGGDLQGMGDDNDNNDNNNGGGEEGDGNDVFQEFMDDGEEEDNGEESSKKKRKVTTWEDSKVFTTKDRLGKSTSGRKAWKARHKKGEFNDRKRKGKGRKKYTEPLGI